MKVFTVDRVTGTNKGCVEALLDGLRVVGCPMICNEGWYVVRCMDGRSDDSRIGSNEG